VRSYIPGPVVKPSASHCSQHGVYGQVPGSGVVTGVVVTGSRVEKSIAAPLKSVVRGHLRHKSSQSSEKRAVFCVVESNWPLHSAAHPCAAKLPPKSLISPTQTRLFNL